MTPALDWRRNLAALWFAEFTAIFGFSFAFPFLPVFLRQLGVHDPSQLALWTGVTGGASGFALAFMSPLWGVLADRYGRKSMLLRAMVGGAITVGLMGFARGPVDVLVLRLVQGATSGTVAAATALVATGTPRHRVGWALGVLSSSIAVGSAVGPFVGGVAAAAFGVRAIFWAGGLLTAAGAVPVLLLVREVPRAPGGAADRPAMAILRSAGPGTIGAIAALIVCQALMQSAQAGFQPLVVLKLLQHLSSGVEAVTGIAFAASGLASAASSVAYATLARRFGFRAVAIAAAVLLASAQLLAAWGPGVVAIVLGAALGGAFYGSLGPSLSSMIGLEAPAEVQARVFGVSSSAVAIGFALGPFSAGLFASRLGVSPAMTICAAGALLLALLLVARVREPAR